LRPRGTEDGVSVELFDLVSTWSHELVEAAKREKQAEVGVGDLTTFATSFFEQYFKNVLDQPLTSISQQSRVKASRLRNDLKKTGGASKQALLLIASFVKYCEVYLDVSAELSAESDDVGPSTLEFHNSFMRRFLKRIVGWAKSENLDELEGAAQQALEDYEYAILEGFEL
jgi:hypothetical protein